MKTTFTRWVLLKLLFKARELTPTHPHAPTPTHTTCTHTHTPFAPHAYTTHTYKHTCTHTSRAAKVHTVFGGLELGGGVPSPV